VYPSLPPKFTELGHVSPCEEAYVFRLRGQPDPRFGKMLLEQFGGANGELAAAMQYSIQGLNCEDPGLKDFPMDIATEELTRPAASQTRSASPRKLWSADFRRRHGKAGRTM
jgi:Manganese containing catalase